MSKPSPVGSEAKPRVLNESPADNSGFPKTSEVEFRGFLGDPEMPEPAGETRGSVRDLPLWGRWHEQNE